MLKTKVAPFYEPLCKIRTKVRAIISWNTDRPPQQCMRCIAEGAWW